MSQRPAAEGRALDAAEGALVLGIIRAHLNAARSGKSVDLSSEDTYPSLPPEVEKLFSKAPGLGLPKDAAILLARKREYCESANVIQFVDAIDTISDGDKAVANQMAELIAPGIAREARRSAVKYGHTLYGVLFFLAGLLVLLVAPVPFGERAVAGAVYVLSHALESRFRLILRNVAPRSAQPPTHNFAPRDFAAIAAYSTLALLTFLCPLPLGARVGLGVLFCAKAVWLLFSYACAIYAANGSLSSSFQERRAFTLSQLTAAWHKLRWHGLASHHDEIAAAIQRAGSQGAQSVILAAKNGSAVEKAQASVLARRIVATFAQYSYALRLSERKEARGSAYFFLSAAIVAILEGRWNDLAEPGIAPAPVSQHRIGRRVGRFVVQLLPAAVAVILAVINPPWAQGPWVPYIGFVVIVTTAALIDLFAPSVDAAGSVNLASSAASVASTPRAQ